MGGISVQDRTRVVTGLPILASLRLSACNRDLSLIASGQEPEPIKFATEYQIGTLNSGQVLFGRLEQAGSDYAIPRSVFVGQSQVSAKTKQITRALLRRSVELNNPDYMILNSHHIPAIEPVAATSRSAEAIKRTDTRPILPHTT
jgi:hypothetical protein